MPEFKINLLALFDKLDVSMLASFKKDVDSKIDHDFSAVSLKLKIPLKNSIASYKIIS